MDVDEPSLVDNAVQEPVLDSGVVAFEVIERATQRGQPRLVNTHGYSYGIVRRTNEAVFWRCTRRNATTKCQASVRQQGQHFAYG